MLCVWWYGNTMYNLCSSASATRVSPAPPPDVRLRHASVRHPIAVLLNSDENLQHISNNDARSSETKTFSDFDVCVFSDSDAVFCWCASKRMSRTSRVICFGVSCSTCSWGCRLPFFLSRPCHTLGTWSTAYRKSRARDADRLKT